MIYHSQLFVTEVKLKEKLKSENKLWPAVLLYMQSII